MNHTPMATHVSGNALDGFVDVALDLPVPQTYTYRVPDDLHQKIIPGSLVLVPLGRRSTTGVVLGAGRDLPGIGIKPVIELLDAVPCLRQDQIELIRWISEYYLTPVGEAAFAMLPAGIEKFSARVARLTDTGADPRRLELLRCLPDEFRVLELLRQERSMAVAGICRRMGEVEGQRAVMSLQKSGLIEIRQVLMQPRVRPLMEEVFTIVSEMLDADQLEYLRRRAPAQFRAVRMLEAHPEGLSKRQWQLEAHITAPVVNALKERKLVHSVQRELERLYPLDYNPEFTKPAQLSADQQTVVQRIRQPLVGKIFEPVLLHGITGSGKTQVYIELIQTTLSLGRSALLLVPEISLTSQAVSRLRTYFADSLAFVHSAMNPGERFDAWRRIRSGDRRVVIGPRSAVFAPLPELGLIIVDEEHDDSYKQQDASPRYHARDVAVMRGKICHCPVVLGSATPSLEAWQNSKTGKFTLVSLPARIDDTPLPAVRIINMQREGHNKGILSGTLTTAIRDRIRAGEQVIILQNRRGYSSFVQCRSCGYVVRCRDCHITMTFHKVTDNLRCHYCGSSQAVPEDCPECHGKDLNFRGIGTQQVEDELKKIDPAVRVIRMDADSTTRRGSHGRIVSGFEQGKYNVLLGTQMVAKGFDFPNVNLVGIVSAETSLLLPDFRATERTFQLLTQLAGRAGRRRRQGAVLIQTYLPDHYSIRYAVHHDFIGFSEEELKERAALLYPPYGRLLVIRLSGETESRVAAAARYVHRQLVPRARTGRLYEPSPSPIPKIRKRYRWHLVAKSSHQQAKHLRGSVAAVVRECQKSPILKNIAVSVDVDPTSLM